MPQIFRTVFSVQTINTIHNRAGDYHFQRLFIKQKLLNTIYLFMNHIDGICFIRNHAQAHVRVELTIPLTKIFS